MNSTLNKVIMFAAGAATGSLVAWQLTKRKYERLIDEEIESVKEAFSRYRSGVSYQHYTGAQDSAAENGEETDQMAIEFEETGDEPADYEKYSKQYDPNHSNKTTEEVKSMDNDGPYVIPPEDFGEESDYDIKSLTYYADGVLTDDWDNVIEDVDELIGEESLTHFGEYEDDSVFVRDDTLKIDYEILRDVRNFADIPRANRGE